MLSVTPFWPFTTAMTEQRTVDFIVHNESTHFGDEGNEDVPIRVVAKSYVPRATGFLGLGKLTYDIVQIDSLPQLGSLGETEGVMGVPVAQGQSWSGSLSYSLSYDAARFMEPSKLVLAGIKLG